MPPRRVATLKDGRRRTIQPEVTSSRALPVLTILAAAAIVPAAGLALAGRHMVMFAPLVHVLVVGAAGALAAAAAIGLSVVAARLNDGRAVLLGFAFSAMAVMLVIHALATPGALVGDNGLVQVAGALNLPLGGAILAVSALPALRRPRAADRLLRVQLAVLTAMAAAGALALVDPAIVPALPGPGSTGASAVFAVAAVALGLLAWRAGRTFVLTRRTSDLVVTVGVVWLISAQYGLLHYGMMDAAWWLAHGFEVAGIGCIGIPAALDLRHGVASRPLVGDLRATELVAHEEAFLGGRVRSLMLRLGEKDASTAGHTRRVATLAVQIGERLGLPETRLRRLALGGLLHDMGKLTIDDAILNKPGKLTDAEFAVIKTHPVAGRELLAELGGFPEIVLALVESHHERLDGRGYPHGRRAGELELEVRILTVADVYDALTADRVYRKAWRVERALRLLHDEGDVAFDAECVAALREVVAPAQPVGGWYARIGAVVESAVDPPMRLAS